MNIYVYACDRRPSSGPSARVANIASPKLKIYKFPKTKYTQQIYREISIARPCLACVWVEVLNQRTFRIVLKCGILP